MRASVGGLTVKEIHWWEWTDVTSYWTKSGKKIILFDLENSLPKRSYIIKNGDTMGPFTRHSENFLSILAINLHAFSVPENIWKWVSKCMFIKNNIVIISVYTTKTWMCKTVTSCACVLRFPVYRRVVFLLQSDVTNYCPEMNYTTFLVVFADPRERGSFWHHCCMYVKNAKELVF